MSFFSKLFGKSRQDGEGGASRRHRAARHGESTQNGGGAEGGRPLFRDELDPHSGGSAGGYGATPSDPSATGRIGVVDPSAPAPGGGAASSACPRCGNRVTESSRFCSNCGAPLRGAAPVSEGPSETTSTISISGLEAYDSEATGQHMLPLPPEAQAAVEALPMGSALLVVRRGPNSGSRFLLDGDLTTAGRHPQSDIFLDDVTVSRRHVEFRRGQGGFTVADVGSLNGTYVNRERIDTGIPLANGDEVQIGKYRVVFFASQRGV
ncbi:FHA domain-containing protein [Streptomyces gossypii]|uniref:FHA domain-containing protein n=1 Tax=Streptomyces gossypii TaxID=2883101 RepID=UPI002882D9B7|nr:FHA domain-containing protein [Streptomyces gossypii]